MGGVDPPQVDRDAESYTFVDLILLSVIYGFVLCLAALVDNKGNIQ